MLISLTWDRHKSAVVGNHATETHKNVSHCRGKLLLDRSVLSGHDWLVSLSLLWVLHYTEVQLDTPCLVSTK